jgi:hypothetical protein
MLWIGGAPGTGKTTVALRLVRRHGLRWYGADTRTWEHRDRALRAGSAAAHRWEAMTPRQRWIESTPEEMLALSLHRERGPMVVEDLRALPAAPLVVAEGTTLPARAVTDPARAVWLVPTPQFQREVLARRGTAPGPAALYAKLREVVAVEAAAHGIPVLTVDGSGGVEDTVAAVEERFAVALAAGPRACDRAERRALLREANAAVAAQVRGYYARPWAQGDAESSVQEFVCECADPACTATVALPVGALAHATMLAPGH